MNTQELQQIQAAYDEEFWQHKQPQAKIRHITLHMGKLLGKLSTYSEAIDHAESAPSGQLREEVVPDLLFFALQIANLYELDLGKAYLDRMDLNRNRLRIKQELVADI